MVKADKTYLIDAPVEVVFAYATDPTRQCEYFAGLREVTDVERLPNGGCRFTFVARVAGVPLRGTAEHVEFVPNERAVVKIAVSAGGPGLEGTETVTFAAEGGKTRVRCVAEYSVAGGFLGQLGERFLANGLEQHIEAYYAALKAHVEAVVRRPQAVCEG